MCQTLNKYVEIMLPNTPKTLLKESKINVIRLNDGMPQVTILLMSILCSNQFHANLSKSDRSNNFEMRTLFSFLNVLTYVGNLIIYLLWQEMHSIHIKSSICFTAVENKTSRCYEHPEWVNKVEEPGIFLQ
jgi:hypothetical protein